MGSEKNDRPTISITSYNQSGGITAQTVNVGRGYFELTDDLIRQVVEAVPHGKPVVVFAVGSRRAFPMQEAIGAALRAYGHSVTYNSAMSVGGAPDEPLAVEIDDDETTVYISPNQ